MSWPTVSVIASWLFLVGSLWGAWFTWNAYRPIASHPRLSVLSFFAGWLTTELALHHLAWQAVVTIGFIWAARWRTGRGGSGLAITLASWVGLAGCLRTARRRRGGGRAGAARRARCGVPRADRSRPGGAPRSRRASTGGRSCCPFRSAIRRSSGCATSATPAWPARTSASTSIAAPPTRPAVPCSCRSTAARWVHRQQGRAGAAADAPPRGARLGVRVASTTA